MSFASPEDGLFQTEETEECRSCGAATDWSDYVSWICPDCYEQENPLHGVLDEVGAMTDTAEVNSLSQALDGLVELIANLSEDTDRIANRLSRLAGVVETMAAVQRDKEAKEAEQ